jgi:HEAT repeat protein
MANISDLILRTRSDDRTARAAVAELAEIGAAAVPDIVRAVKEKLGSVRRLCDALRAMRDPDLIPALENLLGDRNADLSLCAFEILGKSRDERVFAPLIQELDGNRAVLAATALGDFGDRRAIPDLLQAVRKVIEQPDSQTVLQGAKGSHSEELYDSPLEVVPGFIESLAKLGNYELAPLLMPLARYVSKDAYSSDETIRANALRAMQHLVLPGMLAVLVNGLSDQNEECRLGAVEAIFLLGNKGGVAALAQCNRNLLSPFSNQLLLRLRDLVGVNFQENTSTDQTREWWAEHEGDYQNEICYRLGKPIYIPEIIALLPDPLQVQTVVRELDIITGAGFGMPTSKRFLPPNILVEEAEVWWRANNGRFDRGGLYKYGRKQSLVAI